MSEFFFDTHEYSEIKIFQIDKSFYELKPLESNESIIHYMVNKHQESVEITKPHDELISKVTHENLTYYSYVYNETLKDSYWATYLPSAITSGHNFEVLKISFVLFAIIEGNIFATVGGGGIRVIKRFLNHRFGLELFEYLTIPNEDKVVSMTARGISGSLTQQSEIYRNDRSLADCLRFTEIPTKINVLLRDDIIDTVFDFIDFNNNTIYVELGSYFFIKHSITFRSLHSLFKKINEILTEHQPTPISTFTKVKNHGLQESEFKTILIQNLLEDMYNKYGPDRIDDPYKFDIDFIHPSKVQDFYECDRYELKAKGHKKPFYETSNRYKLYSEGLRFLFNSLEHPDNLFEFGSALLGIRVYGYRDNKISTHAMFIQHITCEIKYQNKPFFLIDNNWYQVKNDFIDSINERCIGLLEKDTLRFNILTNSWDEKIQTEGEYNLSYDGIPNYYVFDTIVPDNIEFCDVMYSNSETIYLVHIKNGFDAKIRDLSNQIVISANRLWNDLNSGNMSYLESIIDSHNKKRSTQIDKSRMLEEFKSNKEIVYVMAYKSKKGNMNNVDKVKKSKSNIAKYSLIQCSQDMLTRYKLRIFDISDI